MYQSRPLLQFTIRIRRTLIYYGWVPGFGGKVIRFGLRSRCSGVSVVSNLSIEFQFIDPMNKWGGGRRSFPIRENIRSRRNNYRLYPRYRSTISNYSTQTKVNASTPGTLVADNGKWPNETRKFD